MHFKLRLIPAATAAVLLAACGGGSNSPTTASNTPSSGIAVDGYLQFSKVVCDTNDNGVPDVGEPIAYTLGGSADSGKFTFPQGCSKHAIFVTEGTNADTGRMFSGVLVAPAGATVISPLTTLIAAGMTQDQVNTTLGLPKGTDLLHTDPIAQTDQAMFKKALAVQQVWQKTTELFAGLAGAVGSAALQPIYTEVAKAFAASLTGSAPLVNSSGMFDSAVVDTMVRAAVDKVLAATTVIPEVKAKLTAYGGAPVLATTVASGLAYQANDILAATDITQTTLKNQSSDYITYFVKQTIDPAALPSDPAAIATIAASLLHEVTIGTVVPSGPAGTITFSEKGINLKAFGDDGGGYAAVADDPANAANKVAKIVKKPADQLFLGATVDNSGSGALTVTPSVVLTDANRTLSMRVYSPAIGEKILLKLELGPNGAQQEVLATTTKANAWETLTFTFANAGTYGKVAILPHFNTAVSSETPFYFDDLNLVPTATPALPIFASMDFAATSIAIQAFGDDGGGYAQIGADPSNSANKVLKMVKKVGDMVFFGATVDTAEQVVLTAAQKTFTLRVYSPAVGEKVLLKLAQGANGATTEVQATTTKANAWETLTFIFSDAQLGTYKEIDIFPHFNTTVSADTTFYFDDLLFTNAVPVTPSGVTDYLSVANDAISITDRGTTTPISLTAFQTSPGISVKWPLSSPATLNVTLAQVGNFTMAPNQTLKAAVQITETGSGQGKVMAYIDNVSVAKNGSNFTISVPASGASAMAYGVSMDGAKKAVMDFSSSVKNVANTLSLSAANSILLGDMVNYTINTVSNDFTGITALRGTYKVTIVVSDLPLKKSDGSAFAPFTINVPTALDANGTATTTVPVTGLGLEGYITLTN